MKKKQHPTKNQTTVLHKQLWVLTAIIFFLLSGKTLASYDSALKETAAYWVKANQQDALFLSGKINRKTWDKEQTLSLTMLSLNKRLLSAKEGKYGGSPERFAQDFPKAVAKRLGVKNNPTAPLFAIKAAPMRVPLDTYRRDIWRAAEIKTAVQKGRASKSMQKELYGLISKYAAGGKRSPAYKMFTRNYDTLIGFNYVAYVPPQRTTTAKSQPRVLGAPRSEGKATPRTATKTQGRL